MASVKIDLQYKNYFHIRNHNALVNKILVDMEETKDIRNAKLEVAWRNQKEKLGFGGNTKITSYLYYFV